MKKDVVDDIFDRVKQILGEKFTGEVSVLLEKEEKAVRVYYGGGRYYIGHISRRESAQAKKVVLELMRQGMSAREAGKKAGICQDTVYRFLRKKAVNAL